MYSYECSMTNAKRVYNYEWPICRQRGLLQPCGLSKSENWELLACATSVATNAFAQASPTGQVAVVGKRILRTNGHGMSYFVFIFILLVSFLCCLLKTVFSVTLQRQNKQKQQQEQHSYALLVFRLCNCRTHCLSVCLSRLFV